MGHILKKPRKRITARVSDKVRATLEQAAELLGATVNQFVVQAAYEEAPALPTQPFNFFITRSEASLRS